ncbi:BLUF domain-containing protein [Lichenifustis flavocetrariae]|uniref:BLUF domain-containing protein n=1 Tax=Lichenifustis flavocetrariae TaxID=2949735 RepID=A0AA42CK02_9HYPH|nr:BLUF domain-containing protein [Lichenifustis flavocetrariae]MCW6510054.1 BLUF domain-containing protein [Lichenifustis flavocetrariae]
MIQVVYASRSAVPQGAKLTVLSAIQAASYRRNAERSITGFLINDGEFFYQALEGPGSCVTALLDRIREDPRHSDMRILD